MQELVDDIITTPHSEGKAKRDESDLRIQAMHREPRHMNRIIGGIK